MSRTASASRSAKSMTMKPSMRRRLKTWMPGTPRGLVISVVSYWLIAPQHTIRPFIAMLNRAASRIAPPTLSK